MLSETRMTYCFR